MLSGGVIVLKEDSDKANDLLEFSPVQTTDQFDDDIPFLFLGVGVA